MAGDPELVMPFGKHKGRIIEELPSSYLRWLAENLEDEDEVVEAAEAEYNYRRDHGGHFEED